MTVRSAALVAAVPTSGGSVLTVATVPSDETWIVKEVALFLVGSTAEGIDLYALDLGGAARVWRSSAEGDLAAVVPYALQVLTILEPGTEVLYRAPAGVACHIYLSGSKLAGVAP